MESKELPPEGKKRMDYFTMTELRLLLVLCRQNELKALGDEFNDALDERVREKLKRERNKS